MKASHRRKALLLLLGTTMLMMTGIASAIIKCKTATICVGGYCESYLVCDDGNIYPKVPIN